MNWLISAMSWRLVGLVVIAALLFGAGWCVNGWRKDAAIAEIEADRTKERRDQALAQINAVDRARLEEQRRTAAEKESTNEALKQLAALRTSAAASDAARRELLARVAALANAARNPRDSSSVPAGTATRDPVLLLADVLGRVDQRAGELARYADAARIAGQKCERDYDSLTPAPAGSP